MLQMMELEFTSLVLIIISQIIRFQDQMMKTYMSEVQAHRLITEVSTIRLHISKFRVMESLLFLIILV